PLRAGVHPPRDVHADSVAVGPHGRRRQQSGGFEVPERARGSVSEVAPMTDLEANAVGELSEKQRHNLGGLSRYRRRNTATIARFFLAGAAILMFAPNPRASLKQRELIAAGAGLIAAFLIVRAVTGNDALTRDLQESRVESVEGAIGKRRVSGGRTRST